MSENKIKQSKKKQNIILICSISVMAGIILFFFIYDHIPIQSSELPLDKLNQGYDLVCKNRDPQSLCYYTLSNNTNFEPNANLTVPYGNKQKRIVQVYEINSVKGHCIKEFHVGFSNQKIPCFNSAMFEKKDWKFDETYNPNWFAFVKVVQ